MTIVPRPSPNHGPRPSALPPTAIIVHADAGRTDAGTITWVQSGGSGVSYHYLVGRDGTIYQFVQDARRAWHAGASVLAGVTDCNDYSLGVCFANDQKGEPFTPRQLAAGVLLVAAKCIQYGIPLARLVTHAMVATPPGRKADPGKLFPWAAFMARVRCVIDPEGDTL